MAGTLIVFEMLAFSGEWMDKGKQADKGICADLRGETLAFQEGLAIPGHTWQCGYEWLRKHLTIKL